MKEIPFIPFPRLSYSKPTWTMGMKVTFSVPNSYVDDSYLKYGSLSF